MTATTPAASARRSVAEHRPYLLRFARRRLRDAALVEDVVQDTLKLLEIDEMGFDQMDRMILLTIIDKFGGGPVGLDTIAAAISEESDTIEDVYEPFLIQNGFLNRTPRGRVATPAAYQHFHRSAPELPQGKLF